MKVAQINSSCGFGSTGKIAVEISKKLDEKLVENRIFYSGNKVSCEKNGVLINSKTDIRIHQILSRLFGDQGWHSYFTTKKLVRNLKAFSPDIIHLHNLHGYYLHMGVLFSYLAKSNARVVWTLHDCWAFSGHCTHFTSVNCNKWQKECFGCPQKKAYPYSWFFDRSKTLFNRKQKLYNAVCDMQITAVSNWLSGVAAKSKLLSGRKITVIPNGIDTKVFAPAAPLTEIGGIDISNKKVVLGVANSWSKSKGLDDFAALSKEIPDDFVIVLVGLRPEQAAGLPKNIIGLQHTDSIESLVKLYSTALVYFNASVEETFGLTTIEALSCGTPAITYNATACAEPVTKSTGFVLSPHDIKGVKEAILTVDKKGKDFYKDACQKHAIESYDANKIYKRYIELYFREQEG